MHSYLKSSNFNTTGDRSIPSDMANGLSGQNVSSMAKIPNATSSWSQLDTPNPQMLNLNTTGGTTALFPFEGPDSKPGVPPSALPTRNVHVAMHVYNETTPHQSNTCNPLNVTGFRPCKITSRSLEDSIGKAGVGETWVLEGLCSNGAGLVSLSFLKLSSALYSG